MKNPDLSQDFAGLLADQCAALRKLLTAEDGPAVGVINAATDFLKAQKFDLAQARAVPGAGVKADELLGDLPEFSE